ncbi:class I mannose-6-phosphate isomerase [Microlunatus sp. Gsoil 973]|uniref:class I mannose-6-phosphate isomerase n=1 Tax=Microlunatus sp. Gsoil 973 TaxID=2672569 RepID=UPI0018A88018|nr:class I mannose-6-phosphate isomerase [Microlunatus sp. Gsoil 973]
MDERSIKAGDTSAVVAVLSANQPPDRFYRGGAAIADFRHEALISPFTPEDWVASTTCLAGAESTGLSVLPDGRRLLAAVEEDPHAWLGAEHLQSYGSDTKLLVKLLDAGQRLPVHAHPDGEFAGRWVARPHGKVEAWHMLRGGEVHIGLREPVQADELVRLVHAQDTERLLALLHQRHVDAGDTVYVPAGTLHSIGEGCFIVEVQEPEDLSILLEWRDFSLDGEVEGHLGLGFERALEAVDRTVLSDDQVDRLIAGAGSPSALPPEADGYFRLDRIRISGEQDLAQGFAVLVVIDGAVALQAEHAGRLDLADGTTTVVPAAAGRSTLTGEATVVVCRPPTPRQD